ncbi:hypothetical protein Tco_0604736 [Tanacetum coccineum]
MFQDQYYSFSLEEFAEILGVPCEGACVFTDKWALYELANGLPGDGPYQTFLPSLDDIITLVRVDREGPVTRVRHKKEIDVIEYQPTLWLREWNGYLDKSNLILPYVSWKPDFLSQEAERA